MTQETSGDEGREPKTLVDMLSSLGKLEAEIRSKFKALFEQNKDMYLADFYVMGALRRMMALTKGFRRMIEDRNFLCAAPLVRMQLDNALRVFALSLVMDREALAKQLLDGEPLSKLKDAAGQKLRDGYLVDKLSEHYDWVKPLYQETSGFVHLSERHFYTAITKTNDADKTFHLSLSADDGARADEEYFDVVHAFRDALRLTGVVMLGYLSARAAGASGSSKP
jgi:hypothetical protein